jgi:hypothetical protein
MAIGSAIRTDSHPAVSQRFYEARRRAVVLPLEVRRPEWVGKVRPMRRER